MSKDKPIKFVDMETMRERAPADFGARMDLLSKVFIGLFPDTIPSRFFFLAIPDPAAEDLQTCIFSNLPMDASGGAALRDIAALYETGKLENKMRKSN